jgi:hypothetical protein
MNERADSNALHGHHVDITSYNSRMHTNPQIYELYDKSVQDDSHVDKRSLINSLQRHAKHRLLHTARQQGGRMLAWCKVWVMAPTAWD